METPTGKIGPVTPPSESGDVIAFGHNVTFESHDQPILTYQIVSEVTAYLRRSPARMDDSVGSMLRILLLLLIATPAVADTFTGQATVIDGDTIEIHGQRIRLHGIDAPESQQLCQKADGSDYRCGQLAALALADWIGRSVVSCKQTDTDRYKRAIAICTARGEDVSRWLARSGHAMAFIRYSDDYVTDENAARGSNDGIWQGRFVAPWEWRRGVR